MLGLKDVLPKDLRKIRHELRMNVVKEEMMLVGVGAADLQNVVRWRSINTCGNPCREKAQR